MKIKGIVEVKLFCNECGVEVKASNVEINVTNDSEINDQLFASFEGWSREDSSFNSVRWICPECDVKKF